MTIAVMIIPMLALLATSVAAEAQAGKVPRIGILELASPSASVPGHRAFQQGLRELGYVEGKNMILEYRYADGKLHLLPELAADLVRLKVDAIVTSRPPLFGLPRTRARRFPLSLPPLALPLRMGLFPAWQGQVGTSLG